MRIYPPHNLKSRTDLGGRSDKNLTDRLVRLVREFAKSVIETSSKVQKPKTYDEAINEPVHGNGWRMTIDEEFWNLDSYQTWTYTLLPIGQKGIGCN